VAISRATSQISLVTLEHLLQVLDDLAGRIWSPWAVLLVRFNDDPQFPTSLTKYQGLFTSAGSGNLNMVDFFNDMSHGKVDTSGSQLLGPYTLPISKADYVGNAPAPTGKYDRNGLLNLAKTPLLPPVRLWTTSPVS
jgi:hypothetical protein